MRLPESTAEADGPNLTPVIDVVFLLLIFFLVATEYQQEERELDGNLPEVTQARPLSMTPELVVNILKDGTYRIVGKDYNDSQLSQLIRQAKGSNPHQSVLIRGNSESALKHAVRVMGFCNQADMHCRIAALQEH